MEQGTEFDKYNVLLTKKDGMTEVFARQANHNDYLTWSNVTEVLQPPRLSDSAMGVNVAGVPLADIADCSVGIPALCHNPT